MLIKLILLGLIIFFCPLYLVCYGPFTDEEINYIHKWMACRQKKNHDMIRWEYLQRDFREIYGKFRLRNDLKNIWNRAKRRRISRQSSIVYEVDEITS